MPKKKIGKHLQFYRHCITSVNKYMPELDLEECADAGYISIKLLDIISPSMKERDQLREENMDSLSWCSGHFFSHPYVFSSFRQTLVLFMAALNHEL